MCRLHRQDLAIQPPVTARRNPRKPNRPWGGQDNRARTTLQLQRPHDRKTDDTQGGQHQTSQACTGRKGNGVQRDGGTVVHHARRDQYPRKQQNSVTLPLRTRPTNVNKLHYTTLGPTKTQITSTNTDVPAAQTTFGDTTTGSSATEPTQTKPTMRRPRQPRTNHTAAAATTSPSTDHRQAGQHQTSQACTGRNGNSLQRVGDTVVRHVRQQP